MTRHPTARRVHRDAEPDDIFVARVLETSAWAKQNSRMLVIGGIIAAVLIIGLFYFVTSRRSTNAQAAAQLTQARAVAMSGNSQLAIRELEQFLARYGGTPSADEARLMLASAYLDVGQPQQAQATAQPLADDMSSGLGINAAMLLAASYEAEQHLLHFGRADAPMCWTIAGLNCGWKRWRRVKPLPGLSPGATKTLSPAWRC